MARDNEGWKRKRGLEKKKRETDRQTDRQIDVRKVYVPSFPIISDLGPRHLYLSGGFLQV